MAKAKKKSVNVIEKDVRRAPAWANIVGIIAIVMALAGILNSLTTIMVPKVIMMNQKFMPVFSEYKAEIVETVRQEMDKEKERMKKEEGKEVPLPDVAAFMEKMDQFMNVPAWVTPWLIITGIIGLLISAFFLYAAIALMQAKPGSPNLFVWAIVLSICFAVFRTIVSIYAMALIGIIVMIGAMFAIAVNTVLLIVALTGNRSVYEN